MIRNSILSLFLFCLTGVSFARTTLTDQAQDGWQYLSFKESGIYGAGIDRAHALAKGLKPAKTVTVALIGFGMDAGNKDIRDAVWNNPKERLNGRDDDRNGWVDDMHGWNFLGNATTTLDGISREGDREFLRLKDRYGSYVAVVDDKVYRYDSTSRTLGEAPFPEERAEFDYFRSLIPESELAQAYLGIMMANGVVAFIHEIDARLRQKFPDRQLTRKDFASMADRKNASTLEKNMYDLVALMFLSTGNDSWDSMVEYADTKFIPYQENQYERLRRNVLLNDRKTIGDNVQDIRDARYGNNNLKAGNAGNGTMLAGIIGAKAGNSGNVKGIASMVKMLNISSVGNITKSILT